MPMVPPNTSAHTATSTPGLSSIEAQAGSAKAGALHSTPTPLSVYQAQNGYIILPSDRGSSGLSMETIFSQAYVVKEVSEIQSIMVAHYGGLLDSEN